MVSSVRNGMWVGGLASGLDTQGLIDKLMTIERVPLVRIQGKRDTLGFQKSLLQEINLKAFQLQSKATDLTFSKTFNTKLVDSTDSKLVTGVATTAAEVGAYTINVKQIATTTKAYSVGRIAKSEELGQYLESLNGMGGKNLNLANQGATAGDLTVQLTGETLQTLNLSITGATTNQELVTEVNNKIEANSVLAGKIRSRYNESSDKIEFHLLNYNTSATLSDSGGTILNTFFGAASVDLQKNNPILASTATIRSGLSTQLQDLGLVPGNNYKVKIKLASKPEVELDVSALASTASVNDLINALNSKIDAASDLVNGGTPTGKPQDRLVEFRFNSGTNKVQLVNKDPFSTDSFILTDTAGNVTSTLFGSPSLVSSVDSGVVLNQESFSTKIQTGTFTIEGVQLQLNAATDKLSDVLTRITNSTNIEATYDSGNDVIRLRRKDGLNTPIALGSNADTSNFLTATSLIGGNQQAAAIKTSSVDIQSAPGSITVANSQNVKLNVLSTAIAINGPPGQLRVTLNGIATLVNYDSTAETLQDVLTKVKNQVSGVAEAFYDASTGKVSLQTQDKGSSVTLKIEDVSGNLATALKMDSTQVTGAQTGDTLESTHNISDIQQNSPLVSAGFSTPVTNGTFTINGATFTILNNNVAAMKDIIQSINSNTAAGVQAQYDTTNGRLILTSTSTGNTTISIGSSTDTSNFLSAVGLSQATQDVGQSAIFNISGVNGGTDITKQSNEVNDVINGLTISLKGVTSGGGETINVSADTEAGKKAIEGFIQAYNDTMDLIYDRRTETRNRTLEPLTEEQKSAMSTEEVETYESSYKLGLLSGDSMLGSLQSQLRIVASAVVSNLEETMNSLAQIGITTGLVGSSRQDTQRGRLEITNSDKLDEALKNDPDKIVSLFGKSSTNTNSQGIGWRFKNLLNEYTKSDGLLTARVGRSGISGGNSQMDQQINLLDQQIARMQTNLLTKEESLIKQFSDLEMAISRYQNQSQAFSSQLAKLG